MASYDSKFPPNPFSGVTSGGSNGKGKIEQLEQRCDRLSLLCRAMWSLLRDKAKLTEEDLLLRIEQIDGADGKMDGKVTAPKVATCVQCGRPSSSKQRACMYCQAPMPYDPFD